MMTSIEKREKYTIKEDFYDAFSCIAADCSFTCCCQWKIGVDEATKEQWQLLKPPADVEPKHGCLADYIETSEGQEVIGLTEDHSCPFLNEEKLCRLVIERGDHCLSTTCQTFPRQIHEYEDHIEYALDPCCPEVLDRLYERRAVSWIREGNAGDLKDALLMQIRDQMTAQVADLSIPHTQGMLINAYMMLEMLEQIDNGMAPELVFQQLKSQTEVIRETILGVETFREDTFDECNELLQDLMENYLKKGLYADYLESLSAWAAGYENPDEDTWAAFEKAMKPYENFLRNYLCATVHTETLVQGETAEDILIQLEWIAMAYAAIRHTLYLVWENMDVFTWETARNYIIVLCRMMGYGHEDIRAYLENSFESVIWDWGYFALIMGSNRI